MTLEPSYLDVRDAIKKIEDSEAQSRLIAAAPELLEALKALVEEHFGPVYATGKARAAMWDDARAAIAKAEGKQ